MLAELDFLAFGPVNPVLVLCSATLGCLLGIILAIRAQKYTGRPYSWYGGRDQVRVIVTVTAEKVSAFGGR